MLPFGHGGGSVSVEKNKRTSRPEKEPFFPWVPRTHIIGINSMEREILWNLLPQLHCLCVWICPCGMWRKKRWQTLMWVFHSEIKTQAEIAGTAVWLRFQQAPQDCGHEYTQVTSIWAARCLLFHIIIHNLSRIASIGPKMHPCDRYPTSAAMDNVRGGCQ